MSNLRTRQILEELARRKKLKEEADKLPPFTVSDLCFDKQEEFINDPAKFKTAVCSRRAGKTVSCAVDLLYTAKNKPGVVCLYITLSRASAKKIIWRELTTLNNRYNLGGKINNVELSITFDHPNHNESTIYLTGAKDETEIEKFRGLGLYKVYIDEAQSFRPYLTQLIDDVLVPALYDYDGSLILIGTPGPVKAGIFYEASHSDAWSHHYWNIMDNPYIKIKSGKEPKEILANERKRRGITEQDPTYQRESLGRWVEDYDSLVFRYNENKNHYLSLPNDKLYYVIGVDIGWEDADAIAVLGWHPHEDKVYLVEEYVENKLTITDLVNKIKELQSRYEPVRMVMDAGALGKKIQEEIRQRHGISMEAAEKHRKNEFIELMNDDLRTGKLKIRRDSRWAEDAMLIQWDRSTPGRLKISDVFHSDISDAVLYAWRECKHYGSEAKDEKPRLGTPEYMDWLEEEEARKVEERQQMRDELAPLYDINSKFLGEDE